MGNLGVRELQIKTYFDSVVYPKIIIALVSSFLTFRYYAQLLRQIGSNALRNGPGLTAKGSLFT